MYMCAYNFTNNMQVSMYVLVHICIYAYTHTYRLEERKTNKLFLEGWPELPHASATSQSRSSGFRIAEWLDE